MKFISAMAAEKFLNQIRTQVALFTVFVLLQATCVFAQGQSGQSMAPFYRKNIGRIEGKYIVALKTCVNVDSVVQRHNRDHPSELVQHSWKKAGCGFSAPLNPGTLNQLLLDPNVAFIEEDGTAQINENWGLDRIDQRDLPLSGGGTTNFTGNGAGTHIYIIDTGVFGNHDEFEDRFDASNSYSVITDGYSIGTDCNGHGTHCAGIAAGSNIGVASEATLHSIRVLNCQGSGSYSGILNALEWFANNKMEPAVASMSLGGGKSESLNDAISALVDAGVVFSVAAGNENDDACEYSPSSAGPAITVGATYEDGSSDVRASFSNYGSCVDIFAPGVGIYSSSTSTQSSYTYKSGTSMACPFVSGAAALVRGLNPSMSPAAVEAELVNLASLDKVSSPGPGSPNRLLFIEPPCSSNPCENGGTCNNGGSGGYTCNCADGFEGTNCETSSGPCSPNPCENGGTCNDDGSGGYTCTCADGFEGTNCETNIDDCVGVTCPNGGECVDEVDGYICQCPAGFTGADCNTDINECASSPCENGACNNVVNAYTCTCNDGYAGTNCDIDIDDCEGVTCANGGVCVDQVDGYYCQCSAGYTGPDCSTDINECASSPCQNGACTDEVNRYTCTCVTGYTGTNCETTGCSNSNWSEYENSCYIKITNQLAWTAARDHCIGLISGSNLTSIHSAGENNFVGNEVGSTTDANVWIGLNDETTEGTYRWSDDPDSVLGSYTNWKNREPNNGKRREENCVMLSQQRRNLWSTEECSRPKEFICKYQLP
ncbi:uncharacterized protein [Amphiura filiformis]|uniref:uncharacterized protein n=1 Tax=Amphiura filiformis TaxID=82378 RepID=UPI003B20FE48